MVEILLVVALFATVSIAIYQTFSSGIKIWNYAHQSFPEEDVMITLEKMTHDWHDAFHYSLIEFKGSSSDCEFPTLVMTAADPQSVSVSPYVQQIGKVRYFFDSGKKQILRQQADYGQALKNRWQTPVVSAANVQRFTVTYLYRKEKKLVEQPSGKGVLPCMVRVEIEYAAGQMTRRMMRVIDVPASLSNL